MTPHRVPPAAERLRRIDVPVPVNDDRPFEDVAVGLRAGRDERRAARDTLASVTAIEPMRTGAQLLDFLHASLLVGEDATIGRDRTTGREVNL